MEIKRTTKWYHYDCTSGTAVYGKDYCIIKGSPS